MTTKYQNIVFMSQVSRLLNDTLLLGYKVVQSFNYSSFQFPFRLQHCFNVQKLHWEIWSWLVNQTFWQSPTETWMVTRQSRWRWCLKRRDQKVSTEGLKNQTKSRASLIPRIRDLVLRSQSNFAAWRWARGRGQASEIFRFPLEPSARCAALGWARDGPESRQSNYISLSFIFIGDKTDPHYRISINCVRRLAIYSPVMGGRVAFLARTSAAFFCFSARLAICSLSLAFLLSSAAY